MTTDDLFSRSGTDVRDTIVSGNPLDGLPLWTSDYPSFKQHCLDTGMTVLYCFNILFYGKWEEVLRDDRVYRVISDGVGLVENLRVPRSEVCILWRPTVRDYCVLTDRFDDLGGRQPYVEGVNVIFGADFTGRYTQFLRLLYGFTLMGRPGYYRKYYADARDTMGGINMYFQIEQYKYRWSGGKSISLWLLENAFFIEQHFEEFHTVKDAAAELKKKMYEANCPIYDKKRYSKMKRFLNILYTRRCEQKNPLPADTSEK